jgi:hypothetical protein
MAGFLSGAESAPRGRGLSIHRLSKVVDSRNRISRELPQIGEYYKFV